MVNEYVCVCVCVCVNAASLNLQTCSSKRITIRDADRLLTFVHRSGIPLKPRSLILSHINAKHRAEREEGGLYLVTAGH